jgi:carbon starvation protein
VHDDGKDFVKTNKWIVFGHHFAAISGPGPLVGPVLAAQFGYLPGTLWILIGVVLGGAVQDFVILFASMRRNGQSLAQMVRDELNTTAGFIGVVAILAIMTILLAVLALVVVNVLAESPWGVFTVGATIPIAMFMGGYLRFLRVGKVMEVSIIGAVLLLLAVWGGQLVYGSEVWRPLLTFKAEPLAWAILIYGLAASVLPVWLLLAPRDYLSTFMKLGTIFLLAVGTFLVLPDLQMPAISKFVDGSGLVVPGKLFPFCFITIACGAISGFHTLIASGVTPKIITRESYARSIGYGAMCLESLVAIMAMIAACTLDPGIYLAMNTKGSGAAGEAEARDIKTKVDKSGFFKYEQAKTGEIAKIPVTVDPARMNDLADKVGEKTLYGRTGGAATLAVGMANIFAEITKGRWLDLWYHFAIMFEALFILTTLDAGTRVGRYLLQDVFGRIHKPLGDTRNIGANILASVLIAAGWGFFLIQGVRDPEGGVKALWPIFGIANQMLAAIALCLATTIILKMQLQRAAPGSDALAALPRSPWMALVTLVPLVWLLSVTLTAATIKVFHPDKRMGFWAAAQAMDKALPDLQQQLAAANTKSDTPAVQTLEKKIRENRIVRFNNVVDTVVTSVFLSLVVLIALLSAREWLLLLSRRKPAILRETEPVWLPQVAVVEGKPFRWLGFLTLGLALARELSGEAAFERAKQGAQTCPCLASECHPHLRPAGLLEQPARAAQKSPGEIFEEMLENRYHNGINRCC